MRISQCREEDVELLDTHMPFRGATSHHRERYTRQREGLGTFLVAWREGIPVGSCEVRWQGCAAPEVRAAHPGCPEVNGLGVWPETLRSQGIGTALIREAERLAGRRACEVIGLGVEKNNPRAHALYRRLGYLPSVPYLDCWGYEDGAGVAHRVADACVFMVKRL
ncbi:GNAT family N-acetyltransferase [Streptomyces albus subsp. chlorinus]|uniref:GNAT family N-acetyltransferase n=1 Tax=Streptomyces albus TaxID=1888 RepID=UPI00156EDC70|nr:GNAT family N-acetyltransferase [Streptomyces albus]NSC24566.1 GNAT family N-acetyltransferase [Streptomyces albus subsp. chlorinus]